MKTLTIILLVFFAIVSEGFTQTNIYQNMQKANVSVYNSISPNSKKSVSMFSTNQGAVTTTSDFTKEFRELFKIVQQNQEDLSVFKNLLFNGEVPLNTDPSQGVVNNPNLKLKKSNTLNNLNIDYNVGVYKNKIK